MFFVFQVKLIIPLIDLICCNMNTERTVRIRLRVTSSSATETIPLPAICRNNRTPLPYKKTAEAPLFLISENVIESRDHIGDCFQQFSCFGIKNMLHIHIVIPNFESEFDCGCVSDASHIDDLFCFRIWIKQLQFFV